jgi:hypothetical protein
MRGDAPSPYGTGSLAQSHFQISMLTTRKTHGDHPGTRSEAIVKALDAFGRPQVLCQPAK